ncbi:acyl-CoA dehydrogenase family protein [Sporichthya brevicatena]|uniref:Acyl-CoA dehydrogenase family protein n=1 Tax=Sporichthya brevicatena TaxID=171442 RepID=A0ABN1GQE7_9ACTN
MTETLDAFRARARAFLDSRAERDPARARSVLAIFAERSAAEDAEWAAACRAWQRELFDAGFAGVAWPTDVGGQGLSPAHAHVWAEEQAPYVVARGLFDVTLEIIGPTLFTLGTPEQREHSRAMLRGDEVWCQLFSEPGSGSDLASLRTRAEADGDGWRVTGQKVWTSEAKHARFGYLLARTSVEARKHDGLTAFRLDLDQPGVEVRELRQMTGGSSFSEVFLDGARVGPADVLGEVGKGWRVAMTTLGFERFSSHGKSFRALVDRARDLDWSDPLARDTYVRAVIEHRVLGAMEEQVNDALLAGKSPGPEATLAKLAVAQLLETLSDAVTASLGRALTAGAADLDDEWRRLLLAKPALHIAGGTDEILRTLVAERVLGLPRA